MSLTEDILEADPLRCGECGAYVSFCTCNSVPWEAKAPAPAPGLDEDLDDAALTDDEAHELIRRLARISDEKAAIETNARALIKDLDDHANRILELRGEQLQAWTASKLRGNRRSVRTLFGVAQFRTVPGRCVIDHSALALAWAKENRPELVTEQVNAAALQPEEFAVIDELSGEKDYAPPAGFRIQPARETFSIKSGAKRTDDTQEGS